MVDQRQVTPQVAPQVAIVVDSSACLPACLVEQWKITVVPHTLIIDGVPLQDGVDIQPTDFYRLLRLGQKDVTTSAPNSNAFLQALTSAHELAPDVLCIVVASRFSAAYETAKVAAVTACQSTPGLRVHVMDSRTAAGACALLALDAAQAANSGLPLDFIVQRAEHAIPRLRLLATLDDLSYLRASGRVSWLGYSAASALRINPVFELRQGEPHLLAKPRSRARAINCMIEQMRTMAGDARIHVNIMEADAATDAESLLQEIEAHYDCRDIFVSQMTPVIGAHTGPGLLGVAFCMSPEEASTLSGI